MNEPISSELLKFLRVVNDRSEPSTLCHVAKYIKSLTNTTLAEWCEVDASRKAEVRGNLQREVNRLVEVYQETTQVEWLLEQPSESITKQLLKHDLLQLDDADFDDVMKGAAWQRGRTMPDLERVLAAAKMFSALECLLAAAKITGWDLDSQTVVLCRFLDEQGPLRVREFKEFLERQVADEEKMSQSGS